MPRPDSKIMQIGGGSGDVAPTDVTPKPRTQRATPANRPLGLVSTTPVSAPAPEPVTIKKRGKQPVVLSSAEVKQRRKELGEALKLAEAPLKEAQKLQEAAARDVERAQKARDKALGELTKTHEKTIKGLERTAQGYADLVVKREGAFTKGKAKIDEQLAKLEPAA